MILYLSTSEQNKVTLGAADNKRLLFSQDFAIGARQTSRILEIIDDFLKERRITLSDITGIIVASGPGAFSAVRTGVVLANTIGWSFNIPVLGVRTELLNGATKLDKQIKKFYKIKHFKPIKPIYHKPPNITKPNK